MLSHQYVAWTHWGWVRPICIGKLTIIGSDNGLSPHRRQAIIWTNAGILLIWPLEKIMWNFNPNSYIFIQENAFENVVWKMAAILSQPQRVPWSVKNNPSEAQQETSHDVMDYLMHNKRVSTLLQVSGVMLQLDSPLSSIQISVHAGGLYVCYTRISENIFIFCFVKSIGESHYDKLIFAKYLSALKTSTLACEGTEVWSKIYWLCHVWYRWLSARLQ